MNTMIRTVIVACLLACSIQACTGTGKKGIDPKQRKSAEINARLGTEYLRKNMLDEAKFKLERAIDQDDSIALAHSSYALLMARVGNKKKARRHFNLALDLDEADPDTLNNYGRFLCDEGDYEEALEHFERAYTDAFYKTPEIALSNAGLCMSGINRESEGLQLIKRAIRRNPDFANAYRQLAFTHLRMGDVGQAKIEIDKFHERFGYTISSLQLGVEIARGLKDKKLAADYMGIMGRKFSNTNEYQQMLDDLRDNPIR